MSRRNEDGTSRPSDSTHSTRSDREAREADRGHSADPAERTSLEPPNAFSRQLFAELRRRDHHPATAEADFAGPWRVTRLYGGVPPSDGPRWGCYAAGERGYTLNYREPDQAFLGAAGLALAERSPRFRFQRGADGRLHLMHDGYPVALVSESVPEGCSLPADLTRLADLRVQPQALAHFLMAVPEEVLERAGVLVMRMLREVEG